MVKVNGGNSKIDRITFTDSTVNATAIQMPDGEIKVEYEEKNVIGVSVLKALGMFIFISLLKSFLILPHISNNAITVYFYLIPATIYLLLSFIAIKEMRKKGNENQLRNHAAEHMVHKAYEKLKRIPTISEAREFSRIHYSCGINIFSAFITAQLIGFFVYRYTGYVISEIWLVIVPILCSSIFPFNVLGKIGQFWTTSKPNDSNIKLAITAIKALEEKVLLAEKQ